jgi:hypothetical protein
MINNLCNDFHFGTLHFGNCDESVQIMINKLHNSTSAFVKTEQVYYFLPLVQWYVPSRSSPLAMAQWYVSCLSLHSPATSLGFPSTHNGAFIAWSSMIFHLHGPCFPDSSYFLTQHSQWMAFHPARTAWLFVWCKEHCIYPLILRSYRLKLQYLYHHVQSACFVHPAPIPTHLSVPCPYWFTGKLPQLLWKHSLWIRAHALHIVTYILIIQDCTLFGLVLCTFVLIDTVYRDLTGPLVHGLRTLPTP